MDISQPDIKLPSSSQVSQLGNSQNSKSRIQKSNISQTTCSIYCKTIIIISVALIMMILLFSEFSLNAIEAQTPATIQVKKDNQKNISKITPEQVKQQKTKLKIQQQNKIDIKEINPKQSQGQSKQQQPTQQNKLKQQIQKEVKTSQEIQQNPKQTKQNPNKAKQKPEQVKPIKQNPKQTKQAKQINQTKQVKQAHQTKQNKRQSQQNKKQSQQIINKIQQNITKQHTVQEKQFSEKYVTPQLQQILKGGRYFDIHYFVDDDHTKQQPKVIQTYKPRTIQDVNQQRPLLKIDKNKTQIEGIIHAMKYPPTRPPRVPIIKDLELTDLTFFANSLNLNPDNTDFHQAQFMRYDELYNISKYGKQLPLCLVMVGKNNGNVILKMYESIRRQNYTNYRIIQVDDNSDDNTISKTIAYLEKYPSLKERTSIVVTRYERNALFNRHYANMNYCKDGDIVVDLDSDDWLIGRQTFQLVNSLYQTGKMYNGEHQELWSAFLDFIIYYPGSCCPRAPIYGDFSAEVYEKKTYRNADWRTTHLRTYLWKLYSKIDSNDYIDQINIRKGQYFAESPDVYMIYPILEMSAPKHIKLLDEFVYVYTGSAGRDQTYPLYTIYSKSTHHIYQPLNSLDQMPVRGPVVGLEQYQNNAKLYRSRSITRLENLKRTVQQIYERNKRK